MKLYKVGRFMERSLLVSCLPLLVKSTCLPGKVESIAGNRPQTSEFQDLRQLWSHRTNLTCLFSISVTATMLYKLCVVHLTVCLITKPDSLQCKTYFLSTFL